MLLSVIVPTYNIEKYLRACLDSIVNQTYKNLEIIIIDDNSSDSTPEIIRHYAAKDKRIKPVFHTENKGPGLTRNEGLSLATGDYVTFMDHDDWQDLTKYEKMMAAATQIKKGAEGEIKEEVIEGADIVFCNAGEYDQKTKRTFKLYKVPQLFCDGKVHTLATWQEREPILPSFLPPWAKIMKMDLIRAHNISFSTGENKSDDVFFHYHLALVARSAAYVDEVLYFHRFFPESISGQFRDKGTKMIEDRFHTWADIERICTEVNIPPRNVFATYIREFATYMHLAPLKAGYLKKACDLIKKYDLKREEFPPKHYKFYLRLKRLEQFGASYKFLYQFKYYFKAVKNYLRSHKA